MHVIGWSVGIRNRNIWKAPKTHHIREYVALRILKYFCRTGPYIHRELDGMGQVFTQNRTWGVTPIEYHQSPFYKNCQDYLEPYSLTASKVNRETRNLDINSKIGLFTTGDRMQTQSCVPVIVISLCFPKLATSVALLVAHSALGMVGLKDAVGFAASPRSNVALTHKMANLSGAYWYRVPLNLRHTALSNCSEDVSKEADNHQGSSIQTRYCYIMVAARDHSQHFL